MNDFIRPYREAYEYQVRRTPMVSTDYSALAEALRPQAITVTGLERYSSVHAVDRILEQALRDNKTMSDAVDAIGHVIDDQDGLVLSPQRLELIHWNSMMTASSAAAFRTSMQFVGDRPVFLYYGPGDGAGHTMSAICRPMHMMKVRYDDPILRHMWGPNHHHEYHEWVSMTADEAGDDIYTSPEGREYPIVDGVELRPAPGFDFDPSESMVDDGAFAEAVSSLSGIAARKASTDYNLAELADLDQSRLPRMPVISKAIGSSAEAWQSFRSELGIESGDGTWLVDYAGDGMRANKASFDEIFAADPENVAYAGLIQPAVKNPIETWWVPYETDDGTAYARRYIAAFASGTETVTVVIDSTPAGIAAGDGRTPSAWLWRMKVTKGSAEEFRKGLLAHTKVGQKKTH